MNIFFHLNDEEHTSIVNIFDAESNPFSVGDIIHLGVDELYPNDYKFYAELFQTKMLESNKELEKLFDKTTIKIVEENKYINFKVGKKARIVIEYFCEFVI